VAFVLKLRKKKEKEIKTTTSFEDSIKAKAKLNLLEKRYDYLLNLISDNNELKGLVDLLKLQVISTQGLGEVGDSARPSNEADEGIQELLEYYKMDILEYGKESEICRTDETLIIGALVNLINRSIRREHTNVEIVTVPPEMFMPGWMLRSSRESSLAS